MSKLLNKSIMLQLFKSYNGLEIVKALLTAFIFYALLGAIFLLPIIQVMSLYVPFMEYFFVGIYIYLSLVSIYFNKIFIDTLKTYQVFETINYETFKVRSTTTMTVITFIVIFIVYVFLH